MEENDDIVEDMLLNTLPVILPDNLADAGRLLTEALSGLKAARSHFAPSEVGRLTPAFMCAVGCLAHVIYIHIFARSAH